MHNMLDIYHDPLWELMDWPNWMFGERKLKDNGLRQIINRPHNLVNVKDENGKVVAQRLELVTTPFAKGDVRVSVTDNTLSVECGSSNVKDAENEDVMYRGISSQSYSFALALTPSVDKGKITAENKDGILKINLPLIVAEEKKPETIEISVD